MRRDSDHFTGNLEAEVSEVSPSQVYSMGRCRALPVDDVMALLLFDGARPLLVARDVGQAILVAKRFATIDSHGREAIVRKRVSSERRSLLETAFRVLIERGAM